jgi:protein O-GlcNAc transferase
MSESNSSPASSVQPARVLTARDHAALAQATQQVEALYGRGAWPEAEQICRTILAVDPDHFVALYLLGIMAAQTQRPSEAAQWLGRAAAARPGEAAAHVNHANALHFLGRFQDALGGHDRALAIKPDFAEAHYHRGETLEELGRFHDALNSYERALEIKPDYVEACNNRGNVLQALQRLDDALASYQRALEIKPDYAAAHYNCGNIHRIRERFELALRSYERAIVCRPDYAEAFNNHGNVLQDLQRLEEALRSYERALAIKADFAEAHFNRGVTFHRLKRLDAALDSFERALRVRPDYAEAYFERGTTLQHLKRLTDAVDSFEHALRIRPGYVEAYFERGDLFLKLKRFDDALDSFERALAINPDHPWLLGTWLHAKMQLCDWRDVELAVKDIASKIRAAKKATPPFPALALLDSPPLHRKAAEAWAGDVVAANPARPLPAKRSRGHVIRIGYFSSDYHYHATAHLTAGLFEQHDRRRFYVAALSYGPGGQDGMRKRLTGAFDEFQDVHATPDEEVARMSRNLELDIAVDLNGFTRHERPGIFSRRAAPIQVSYLGYPGTTAAPYMDYIVADPIVIPVDDRQHYSEKIAYLPHSYQVNDRTRPVTPDAVSRAELGLPAAAFVFCCFNNAYKITPEVFGVWMRILRQVDHSVLWLLEDTQTGAGHLREAARSLGVSPERLVFAKRMPHSKHMARHRAADLFLDTLPYNAHTTASDALWSGLPVLTRLGRSFAGRVAASLLMADGLPELITSTAEEYEALAIDLANDPVKLAHLKDKVERNRLTMPLFDTELFTRSLENAYIQMYERYHGGSSPEHIYVPS